MGYGDYSLEAHQAITKARASLPQQAVFGRSDCDPAMNPKDVKYRVSRDSPTHPESTAIVFALDVSGSMGEIPHQLATKTLPTFMEAILPVLPDPQVLFMAIGNASADRSPLQVGQFESEAGLMDRWLSATHLEGGGGGWGESYELAMYFGARHIQMDCLEKRGRKGYFFITGDEVPFVYVAAPQVRSVIGDGVEANIDVDRITAELLEKFHVFMLIPDPKRAPVEGCEWIWRQLLHERTIVLATPEDTAVACALLIGIQEGRLKDPAAIAAMCEQLGRTGEARDRVVRVVTPFAEALARGPLPGPKPLTPRTDDPGLRG